MRPQRWLLAVMASARSRLEAATGLALVTRTLRQTFHAWRGRVATSGVSLRPGPVIAMPGIQLVDANDAQLDISERFELRGGRLVLKAGASLPIIPSGSRVEIEYVAGFGAAADVPDDLLHALRLILLAAYRREADATIPAEAEAIIASRRGMQL